MRSQRITVPEFTALKAAGQKISMVTAYDYTMARLVDAAGVEGILVGDSMSMVVQGHDSTLPVTLDEMIYHAEMVGRAVEHALLVVDMPFPSFHLGKHRAIENAGRPDADLVFGFDNLVYRRLLAAGVLAEYQAARRDEIPADIRGQFADSLFVTPIEKPTPRLSNTVPIPTGHGARPGG